MVGCGCVSARCEVVSTRPDPDPRGKDGAGTPAGTSIWQPSNLFPISGGTEPGLSCRMFGCEMDRVCDLFVCSVLLLGHVLGVSFSPRIAAGSYFQGCVLEPSLL